MNAWELAWICIVNKSNGGTHWIVSGNARCLPNMPHS